jgi:hypothetical protein
MCRPRRQKQVNRRTVTGCALVGRLLDAAQVAVGAICPQFDRQQSLRKKAQKVLRKCTAHDNIKFDAMSRVSHVTDATDWRVEYPFVVLTPTAKPKWRVW